MHPAPKTLWWSNHRSVRGYAESGCVIAHLSPITRRTFVKCGDPVALLQKRRRAANAVTCRSHPRLFVLASNKKGQRARGQPQADARVSYLVPRRCGMSRLELEHYHPVVTVACEDSAFACRLTAGCEHEAKRRDRLQPAPAGETRCWDRGLGGRERPMFSGCVGRRRRRELLDSRLFREPGSISAATGMVAHVDLLSYQRVCRSRGRPRTGVPDRQNPCQSQREREPRCESRPRIGPAKLHVRHASFWRTA